MAAYALFSFLALGLGVVSEAQHPIMHDPISACPSHPPATSASAMRTRSEKKWPVALTRQTVMLRRPNLVAGDHGDAAPASSSTKHPPLHCYCVILLEQMSEPDPESAFLSHCGVSDCQKVLDGDDSLEDENHRRFGRADDLFGHSPSRGSCLWSESLIP